MSNSSKKPTNKGRTALGGALGALLITIVLFVQYGLGINVLDVDKGADTTAVPPAAQPTAEVVPAETSVAAVPGGELVAIPGGYDGGWFQVYFTDPIESDDEADFHGSPVEAALVAALDKATTSIDAALFELNSQMVTDALIAAHAERDVRVRVVVDGEFGIEKPETTVDQLELAGIPVVSDGTRGGKMHNKFFVIDGVLLWTGSTNITHNGLYKNNNNAILIRSSRLAANFTREFEELFAGNFGKTSEDVVPNPALTVEGVRIETYFEAEGEPESGTSVQDRLAELIRDAETVRFMAFAFTDSLEYRANGTNRPLTDLVLQRAEAGQIKLQGIVEASQRRFLKTLFCAGLNVRQDGNNDGILHHKVFIIDDSIVVLGSFNFSESAAEDNDENVLIIHSQPLAQVYLAELNERWTEAVTPPLDELGCN